MAGVLQHLRSSTLNKRPNPASMVDGQIAINYASGSPGAFFKDSNGNLVKVGPVHVGATAPNVSPASGGTAGNSLGEQWLDTSGGTYVFKIWDGATWRSEAGEFVNVTGDTMTGSLTMGPSANLIFEGSTDDGFETTLTVVDPTADRTITLPNISGTVVTTGDSGTVTSTMIADGTIVNGDVSASAAIAGTKISPDFGSQTIQTTGVFSHALGSQGAPTITFAGDTDTGIYSPGANQVAITTSGTGRLFVDASGNVTVDTNTFYVDATNNRVGIGTTSPSAALDVNGSSNVTATSLAQYFGINAIGTGSGVGNGIFAPASNTLGFSTGASERARITSEGTVNIKGAGTAGVTQAVSFNGSAPVDSLVLTSGGNVGIGTASPNAPLCVNGLPPQAGIISAVAASGGKSLALSDNINCSLYVTHLAGGALIGTDSGNAIRFATNGFGSSDEKARIDNSGRLLVGTPTSITTAIQPYLQVQGTGENAFMNAGRWSNDVSGPGFVFGKSRGGAVGTRGAVANDDILGEIAFYGDNGSSFNNAASIVGAVDGEVSGGGASDMPGRLVFSTTKNGEGSPTERMRITQDGILLFGNISSAPSASVFGAAIGKDGDGGYMQFSRNNTGSTTHVTFANPNGVVGSITTNGSATAYNTSSDYRLKENVTPVADGINRLQQLKPSRFNFIADPDKIVDGFIAHEVQAVVPECVTGEKDAVDENGDPVYQGIDQSKLVPLLTAALQEAITKIESLEARLTAAGI